MKLDEFKKPIEAQRQEIKLTNLEKIAKIVETANDALKTLNKSFNKEETVLESDCGCDDGE